MYNRYIRNDNGSYTRVPQEEVRQDAPRQEPSQQAQAPPSPPPPPPGPGPGTRQQSGSPPRPSPPPQK